MKFDKSAENINKIIMSEKNSSKENSTKAEKKEQGFNLVETVMEDLNKIDKTQSANSHKQINPENNTNNKPKDSISVNALHEMKKKIDKHDYNAIKELLDSQNISQQSKNQLLNFSFNQLHSTNNANQRKIINELMKHGADPNCRLKFDISAKKKLINIPISKDIKITPLIYCCIKGDYELFELIKDKINLKEINDENYFFYFFENIQNFDNKYKIANSILQQSKENKNNKININDFDKKTGMSLLMLSVKYKNPKFIKLLLDNGADINLKNSIYGDTALHYAAQIKNKEIIELLIENNNCDYLIKNSKNETIIDIATKSANTEIYSLLAKKYGDQKKLYEENQNKDSNQDNQVENNTNTSNTYNNNNNDNNNNNNNNNEKDILNANQVKKNIQDFSSYIEIPFQFTNNQYNYVEYYDANIKNQNQKNMNEVDMSNDSLKEENDIGNIKTYMKFKGAPILNINLKTKEDEDLLILDNLKAENEEFDEEFEDIEKKLEKLYKEHNNLLNQLSEVNSEIKSVNKQLDSCANEYQDKENKYLINIQKLNDQEEKQKSILNVLLNQKQFLKMNHNHNSLITDINYLSTKFKENSFDEKYVKEMLKKDIIDFQLYIKSSMKSKQKSINNIRSSLQEILELNEYDFTVYLFGSYETGLSLPWSDLDLILISKNLPSKHDENFTKEKLKEIQNLLSKANWVDKDTLKMVNYRAFPYLKFSTDEKHGFMKVNLTIKDIKNKGYECAKLTCRFLNSYKNMEPLVLVLKNLMYYSKTLFSLSDYYDGQKENLNSYSIVLMVVFFIQYQIMQLNIQTVNNPEYLGELFVGLLQYYNKYETDEFVFVRTGIEDILENVDFLELKESKRSLVIIDPLNHKNNVFGKDIKFEHIKIIFNVILNSSRVKCDCSCHYIKDYYNNNGQNINNIELGTEHCILKKMFKTANRINSNAMNI